MTKTIIIGKENLPPQNKRIEFIYVAVGPNLNSIEIQKTITRKPSDYKYIELITRNYANDLDAMFAYNNPKNREAGMLYFGKWNDGVVER